MGTGAREHAHRVEEECGDGNGHTGGGGVMKKGGTRTLTGQRGFGATMQ